MFDRLLPHKSSHTLGMVLSRGPVFEDRERQTFLCQGMKNFGSVVAASVLKDDQVIDIGQRVADKGFHDVRFALHHGDSDNSHVWSLETESGMLSCRVDPSPFSQKRANGSGLIAQCSEKVKPMVDNVTKQVPSNMATDLRVGNRPPVATLAQAVHFIKAPVGQLGCRFLSRVQSKSAKEPRQPDKPGADVAETKNQIPVEDEIKALIEGPSDFFPYAPSPKESFLGYIVGPGQHVIIVG